MNYRLTKSHTGEYLAQKVSEILKEYGLVDTMLGMAMDNASNNDSMLKELPHILPASASVGTEYQIRCFGHIINLVCQAFLSLFNTSKKALKADGPTNGADTDDNESSDEDDTGDDGELIEDQQGEREDGDWQEIERLSRELVEVAALDETDKQIGRNTMAKVFLSLSYLWFYLILL